MSSRPAQRLLVLGWDAADWQAIDPLLARGQMPNLARLLAAGVRADLRTLEPRLSPILWTTIATGKTADRHGVLNFVEPDPSGDGVRISSSTTRRTKALWNILTQRGMRVHSIGWYASHPAEPIGGTCVTNLLMEGMPAAAGTPWPMQPGVVHAGGGAAPGTADRIAGARVRTADVTRDALRELLPNLAQAARGDARPAVLARELARMRSVHGAAMAALRGGGWDCAFVFHDTIDTIGHHFMELRPPRMPHVKPADLRVYGDVMDCTYRMHDRLLGELLEACGPGTSVILVSDHGFRSGADRPAIHDVTDEERAALEASWHREHGIAVLAGPGFRAGERIGEPSLLDVAPTVLAALGLPVGADMDGRVLAEAFAEPPSIATVPSWETEPGECGMHPPEMRQDPFEAADAVRQLVDLGYMADVGEDRKRLVELVRRESRYNLASVLLSSGRAAEAVPLARALAEERPGERRYASMLAQVLQAAGEPEACLEAASRWAVLEPASSSPAMLRVAALAALGRNPEAGAALDALLLERAGDAASALPLSLLCVDITFRIVRN